MPSNGRDPSHLARIRDNQRRSRAQRKEYLKTLQRRVQEYELRGVEATVEIQHAAQVVARENVALRRLLARHGVSQAEIDREIQAVVIEGNNLIGVPKRGLRQEKAQRKIAPAFDERTSCNRVPISPESPSAYETSSATNHAVPNTYCPLAPNSTDPAKTSSVETSCIDAATIISQMRGDGDAEYARSMLGCDGAANCKVKNTMLFQVLDEI